MGSVKEKFVWLIVAVLYLSTLVILVRPGSKGTVIIGNLLGTFTDLVRGVAGQTYDPKANNGNGGWSIANA